MTISSDEKKVFKEFEKTIGYKFKKREHLKRALTHKSFANEQKLPATEHNERYEYLGDAVLELSVSHILMERFPQHPEGELSKLRAAIVNEGQLADVARSIELGRYLYLGKGESQTGGRDKASLLSDAFEAVLGAIYLDRSFDKAFDVVEKLCRTIMENAGVSGFLHDYKTRLQEISQAVFRAVPTYKLMKTTGPDHCKLFEIHLFIRGELFGIGTGNSKKAAEQEAACQAIEKLEAKHVPS